MAKPKNTTITVEEVLKKSGGAKKKAKGTPAKKKQPSWLAYKAGRGFKNKQRTIDKHLKKNPNDKQSASALQSLQAKRFA